LKSGSTLIVVAMPSPIWEYLDPHPAFFNAGRIPTDRPSIMYRVSMRRRLICRPSSPVSMPMDIPSANLGLSDLVSSGSNPTSHGGPRKWTPEARGDLFLIMLEEVLQSRSPFQFNWEAVAGALGLNFTGRAVQQFYYKARKEKAPSSKRKDAEKDGTVASKKRKTDGSDDSDSANFPTILTPHFSPSASPTDARTQHAIGSPSPIDTIDSWIEFTPSPR